MVHAARADPLELAWAAGFFDGEGSTIARRDRARAGYRQLVINVPQSGGVSPPAALIRFRRAMLGMGAIGRRNDQGVYCWRTNGFPEARAVLRLLWRHLGPVKRRQAAAALLAVRQQYATGRFSRRRPRSRSQIPPLELRTISGAHDHELERRAWAAGFLDAEGCFGLARKGTRNDGARWYRIRCSASQHGEVGKTPAVLLRLHLALHGLGRIERHGDPDDFKWLVEGLANVEAVLGVVGPWLGPVKQAQAARSIVGFVRYRASRVRGDAEHCRRGHSYDVVRRSHDGSIHRRCNACARLLDRRKRAALGIPPRQFRDVRRRYTE